MTRPANAARWQHTGSPLMRRNVGWGVACLVALLVAQYIAGYAFLWSVKAEPRRATPLTTLRYAYYYWDHAEIRRRVLICWILGVGVVAGSALAVLLPRPRSLHGDARFATRREIAAAGLLSSQGIILGSLGRRYLMLDGQQGVALAAPPRSGKGVGVVVPNALNWPGSLVCVDIKCENWTITAGYRKSRGQACYLFNPLATDGRTARWNPLSYVSEHPAGRINDLQRIADMLFPEVAGTDPFWIASARSLFLGIALYLFETPSVPKTFGEILRQGMASLEGFEEHWKRIVEGRMRGASPLSPECVRALYDTIKLAPPTSGGIRKTFTSRLELWQNPILDAATSESDFDLRELRAKPISIYVGVNPDDRIRLRPVLSLFFQQAIGLQTRELPEHNPALKYQVMMLLDEFTSLGRIPVVADSISFLPGYNVRVVLVIQTPAQLHEVYGPDATKTILKSLAGRIAFTPRDFDDAKEISDELGFQTVTVRSHSRPRFGFGGGRNSSRSGTVTSSEQKRALLLPQEVKEMGPKKAIIFYEGLRPIACRKIRYFEDPRFKARLLTPPTPSVPHPRAVLAASPPQASAESEEAYPSTPAVREATTADLERLETLTLDDIDANFDGIEVPQGRPLKPSEIEATAHAFLEVLEQS
jgi:type IV secretion system protein VirD4